MAGEEKQNDPGLGRRPGRRGCGAEGRRRPPKATEGQARGRGRAASSLETASLGYMTPPNFLVPASSRLYPGVELPRPGLWHPTRTGPGRRSWPLPSPHLFWPRETSVWLCPWCPGSPRPSRAASPWRRGLQGANLGPLEKLPFSLAEAKRDL